MSEEGSNTFGYEIGVWTLGSLTGGAAVAVAGYVFNLTINVIKSKHAYDSGQTAKEMFNKACFLVDVAANTVLESALPILAQLRLAQQQPAQQQPAQQQPAQQQPAQQQLTPQQVAQEMFRRQVTDQQILQLKRETSRYLNKARKFAVKALGCTLSRDAANDNFGWNAFALLRFGKARSLAIEAEKHKNDTAKNATKALHILDIIEDPLKNALKSTVDSVDTSNTPEIDAEEAFEEALDILNRHLGMARLNAGALAAAGNDHLQQVPNL